MNKTRYWIGAASKDHVRMGIKGGFAQFCHGKLGPAEKLSKGDWVILYSSKQRFGEPTVCQEFTAIGQVVDAAPTQVEQAPGFKPYRRKVRYHKSRAVNIRPLIEKLSFIRNRARWGMAFRFGFLEIRPDDFGTIATEMLSNAGRDRTPLPAIPARLPRDRARARAQGAGPDQPATTTRSRPSAFAR
ncbi:MAG TPA: EVE domain-containing protein [bacterium]|nr:EVE domain-containing protein [bacterium]